MYTPKNFCVEYEKKTDKSDEEKKSKLKCRQPSWSDCRPWISLHTTHTHIYYLVGWRRLRCFGCLTANATVTHAVCCVWGCHYRYVSGGGFTFTYIPYRFIDLLCSFCDSFVLYYVCLSAVLNWWARSKDAGYRIGCVYVNILLRRTWHSLSQLLRVLDIYTICLWLFVGVVVTVVAVAQ